MLTNNNLHVVRIGYKTKTNLNLANGIVLAWINDCSYCTKCMNVLRIYFLHVILKILLFIILLFIIFMIVCML